MLIPRIFRKVKRIKERTIVEKTTVAVFVVVVVVVVFVVVVVVVVVVVNAIRRLTTSVNCLEFNLIKRTIAFRACA